MTQYRHRTVVIIRFQTERPGAARDLSRNIIAHILDSAGQPVFDDLRSLFYSRDSTVYVVVVSLVRLADECVARAHRPNPRTPLPLMHKRGV